MTLEKGSNHQPLITNNRSVVWEAHISRELRPRTGMRITSSRVWYVLVIGGILTVLLSFFFGTEVLWLHRLLVAALTVVVVLLLYVTYQVQYPFSGSVRVELDAYRMLI